MNLVTEIDNISPELKERWVNALRSEEYKQGRSTLCSRFESVDMSLFCCLGVLCDLINPNGWTEELYPNWENNGQNLSPVDIFVPGLSLKTAETLSRMNDNGRSFSEIADWIEENL